MNSYSDHHLYLGDDDFECTTTSAGKPMLRIHGVRLFCSDGHLAAIRDVIDRHLSRNDPDGSANRRDIVPRPVGKPCGCNGFGRPIAAEAVTDLDDLIDNFTAGDVIARDRESGMVLDIDAMLGAEFFDPADDDRLIGHPLARVGKWNCPEFIP